MPGGRSNFWTIHHNTLTWSRKHVLADLKPYVCTSELCEMKLFADRQMWFTHELQNHLVEWRCCFCSHLPQQTVEKFQDHVRKKHRDQFSDDQLPALVKFCQQPLDRLSPTACPFCDEWEAALWEANTHVSPDDDLVVTPRQFRHHVGRHMEQLALFAIPRGYKEDDDDDDDDDADSGRAARRRGSDDSSDRSVVRPDYEEEDNPPLHVAAFEGREDDVRALLDESLGRDGVRFQEGDTWGSGRAHDQACSYRR
jgi:hypothetical protein